MGSVLAYKEPSVLADTLSPVNIPARLILLGIAEFGRGAAQSAIRTVPGADQMLAGNLCAHTMNCCGGAVTVSGNGNSVRAVTVEPIVFYRRQNTVTCQKSLKGTRPVIRITGTGNKVLKQ